MFDTRSKKLVVLVVGCVIALLAAVAPVLAMVPEGADRSGLVVVRPVTITQPAAAPQAAAAPIESAAAPAAPQAIVSRDAGPAAQTKTQSQAAAIEQSAQSMPAQAPVAPVASTSAAAPALTAQPVVIKPAETEPGTEVEVKGQLMSMSGVSPTLTLEVSTTMGTRVVTTTAQTIFHGMLSVGVRIEVEGLLQPDGSVQARTVSVEEENEQEQEVEFRGPIQALPTNGWIGEWVVNGMTVTVNLSTTIDTEHGMPMIGALAEVKAIRQADGSLLALSIKIEDIEEFENEVEFKGTISNLTGTGPYSMTVNGHVVTTDASTQIVGALADGAFVEVHGLLQPDGSVLATLIKVEQPEVQELEFTAQIVTMPANFIGEWSFSNGVTVTVDANTLIDQSHGAAMVGARAEVKAEKQADGSWLALRIKIEDE